MRKTARFAGIGPNRAPSPRFDPRAALSDAQKKAVIDDRPAVPAPARKELVTRLRKGRCEWCQQYAAMETHQVRKLADLTRPGRPQPAWAQRMARMRRKTLIVCVPCHQAIHAGTLTAVTV